MRLVRFLRRSFHEGRLIEAGEEALVSDETALAPHMVDVAAEAKAVADGASPTALPDPEEHPPVFRADLAHSAGMPVAPQVTISGGGQTSVVSAVVPDNPDAQALADAEKSGDLPPLPDDAPQGDPSGD